MPSLLLFSLILKQKLLMKVDLNFTPDKRNNNLGFCIHLHQEAFKAITFSTLLLCQWLRKAF